MSDAKTVAILGAGVAGLVAAKTLKQYGFSVTLFEERSHLGGVWANNYKSLRLLEPYPVYGIPDWPWPKHTQLFPPAKEVVEYLTSYAKHFGIFECIQFNTRVVTATPHREGSWQVEIAGDSSYSETRFDSFVIAPGMFNLPKVPNWEGCDTFEGEIIHSSQFKDKLQIKGKNVAVIGFSRSAMDISVDALTDANSVTLVHRSVRWPVPEKILGLIRNHVLLFARWPTVFAPPWIRANAKIQSLHNKFSFLVDGFWKFFELLLSAQCRLKARKLVPDRSIKLDLFTNLYITPSQFFKKLGSGHLQSIRSEIKCLDSKGIRLVNGQYVPADVIICGTGWKQDYSFLPTQVLNKIHDNNGMHLYRHMIHPDVPGFAFVGGVQGINSATCYAIQATWVARWLRGKFKMPSPDEQREEIDALTTWNEKFVTPRPNRLQILNLHQLPYIDELLQDMGITRNRKKYLAEYFVPYGSRDYKSVTATTTPQ